MTRKPRDAAWLPAPYEATDIEAIQAVYNGKADAYQQRRALDWIVEQAAETYGESFRSDVDGGDRETSFALGRAFVGRQVVKLVKMSPAIISGLRKKDG